MKAIKDLLSSKKALVTIATALVNLVVAVFEIQLSEAQENTLVSITAVAVAYIIGQGIADAGKEAKKLELEPLETEEEQEQEQEEEE
jgi:hypothetical protein